MKKLYLIILLLSPVIAFGANHIYSFSPFPQYPFVRKAACSDWTVGTSVTCTVTAPTDGNAEILAYSFNNNVSNKITSITQTGATWVEATTVASVGARVATIWYALNVSGAGTAVTVNLNYTPSVASTQGGGIFEIAGLLDSGALDALGNSNAGTQVIISSTTPSRGFSEIMVTSTRSGANSSGTACRKYVGISAVDIVPDFTTRSPVCYQYIPYTTGGVYTNFISQTSGGQWQAVSATFKTKRPVSSNFKFLFNKNIFVFQ